MRNMTTLPDKVRNITAKYRKQIDILRDLKHKGTITPSAAEQMIDRLKSQADKEKEEIMRNR